MNKRTILGFLIIIIGCFIVGSTVVNLFKGSDNDNVGEQAVSSYNAENLNQLTIRSSSINIDVVQSDNDQLQLELSSYFDNNLDISSYVNVIQQDDAIELKVSAPSQFFSFIKNIGLQLDVYIPEQLIDNINIEAKSGSISVEDTLSSVIAISTSSGNIDIEQMVSDTVTLSASSGNIKAEQIVSDEITVSASSGNIELEDFEANLITASTNSGNQKLEGSKTAIQAKSSSGNINVEVPNLTDNSKLQSSSGNVNVTLDKQPTNLYVSHDKGSGSTSINKSKFTFITDEDHRSFTEGQFGDGEIKLEVITQSGNFKLN